MNQIPKSIKLLVGLLVAVSAIATSSFLLWSAISTRVSQALPQKCVEDGTYEPAATTMRTVRLPEFGLELAIPENYRTLKRESNRVEILHPDDYAFITCIDAGGEGLGHGYYSEYVTLVESGTADDRIREATSNGATVTPYNQGAFSGHIISRSGQGTAGSEFLGTIGNNDRLFNIYASCDCDTDRDDLDRLMAKVRPME
jgi:hypothetical protein